MRPLRQIQSICKGNDTTCLCDVYLGSPPKSHSEQMYGPGRKITQSPKLAARWR